MQYDLGGLAAVTARCGFFDASASPLLQDEPPDGPSQATWHLSLIHI